MNLPLRAVSLVVACAAVVFGGCSMQSQNVRLDPPIQVSASDVGHGKVVWLQVRDARPRKTLGIVGDLEGRYAYVSVEDDFRTPVYQRVSEALRKMGFTVQPTPGAEERSLTVEVRDIKYQSAKKGIGYETEVSVAVAAMALNRDQHYDRVYSAGETKSTALMPSAEETDRAVNDAVATAVQELLADGQLVAFLVK